MRTLITGVSSEIGRSLSNNLVSQGHEVVGFDIKQPINLHEKAVFVQGDVRDVSMLVRAAQGCNTGIHLAVQADDAKDLIDVNVSGAYHFMIAAQKSNFVNSILASSAPVHLDEQDNRELLRTSADEDHAYDLSKVLQEVIFRDFHAHGTAAMCLRFGHIVWGERELNLGTPIPLTDFDYCRGGWVALEDVVTACTRALNTTPDQHTFEVLNIVGAQSARKQFNITSVEQRLGFEFAFNFADYE